MYDFSRPFARAQSGRGSAGHRLRGRGGDRRRGAPQRDRRGAARGSRGCGQGGAVVAEAGDARAHVLHAVVVEADPGAAARSGTGRPRRARPRDRLRVASRDRRPARRRPRAAREGTRHRVDDLETGLQAGRPPDKLFHNCSGKHAGMLALCRANGWPTRGLPPARAIRCSRPAGTRTPRPRTSTPPSSRPRPTAAASSPSRSRSSGWRTRSPASSSCRRATRVADAMRAHPELVGGPDGVDFELMRPRPAGSRRAAPKACSAPPAPDGLGIALKSEDGSSRPLGPALAAFLAPLGVDLPGLVTVPVDVEPRRAGRRGRGRRLRDS